jgi:hypothetical protein
MCDKGKRCRRNDTRGEAVVHTQLLQDVWQFAVGQLPAIKVMCMLLFVELCGIPTLTTLSTSQNSHRKLLISASNPQVHLLCKTVLHGCL